MKMFGIPIAFAALAVSAMILIRPTAMDAQVRKVNKFDTVEVGTIKAKKILLEQADGSWLPLRAPIGAKPEKGASLDRIDIESKDGKNSLQIMAVDDGVGIWLTGKEGTILMFSGTTQGTYFGVHDKESMKGGGCPLALIAGGEDRASIQITDGKKYRFVGLAEILKFSRKKE